MKALLSTTYFGPIQWYQKLYRAEKACIERHEYFLKQTYRNRCVIATTQGTQALTVPIERQNNADSPPLPMDKLRISNHGNWRHLHWNALKSAYGDSPFFEYYEDDLRPFFEPNWDFLFDYNRAICSKMCELLDIHPQISYTEHYIKPGDTFLTDELTHWHDFRDAIQPKHPAPDPDFVPRRYYQVYEAKQSFLPNLSIVDLLFNMGPEAIFYL